MTPSDSTTRGEGVPQTKKTRPKTENQKLISNMNLFKKFFLCLFASVLALGFAACGSDDDDPAPTPGGGGSSTTETKILTLSNSDATTQEVPFNVKENWKATSDAAWCKVSPEQGTAGNGKKITISIEENLDKEARTAHVTVKTINSTSFTYNITITQPAFTEKPKPEGDKDAPEGMKLTADLLVQQIKVGWNLGNTCEATDEWTDQNGIKHDNGSYVEGGANLFTETSWQKENTTKAMFTALKNAGFNAIRVPVRWYRHADKDMNINKEWMARVKEIVDYAVSQDMYVILNSHHDNWYDRLPVGYNEKDINTKFENMWTQIATYFKNYDEHLIFAGANEIIRLNANGTENWNAPTDAHFKFANNLMQIFVNTVRATGGNNEWRCLMVQPWACNPGNAISNQFVMPTDTKNCRLILEFHCYDPYDYATPKKKHDVTDDDRTAVKKTLDNLNRKFVMKNIPCIMAEFGSTQDNTHPSGNAKADQIRADYHKFIVSSAKPYDIPCFYWDNYCFETTGENFGLLDRKNCNFPARAKIALDGIMAGLK